MEVHLMWVANRKQQMGETDTLMSWKWKWDCGSERIRVNWQVR